MWCRCSFPREPADIRSCRTACTSPDRMRSMHSSRNSRSQTVHARYLDDLAVARDNGKPTTPAVFLSGNGPLVEVLQYEMRSAGDGKTFVRGVKDYVKRYSSKRSLVPPEHVLVFDEAQRAFDTDKMRESHDDKHARSEPEEFISFADRIPEWCVVIGLIGSGQEIHVGE